MLDPSLQLLALVGDGLAGLGFEQGCFDASGAGGSFDPLVHPSGVTSVGGRLERVCQYSLAQRRAVC